MKLISGLETSSRLRCLRPILVEWIRLNRLLGRRWSSYGDVPWWYNERALLSLFVGAVWRTNGEAFEEYSELKRAGKRVRSGRVDLWFATRQWEFWAEAKQCEIPATRRGDQIERVAEKMNLAKADVRRCVPDGWTRRLAVVFGAPYLRPCTRSELESRMRWFVEQGHTVDHDALAWVFPTLKKQVVIRNWMSPGCLVWIKEVRR